MEIQNRGYVLGVGIDIPDRRGLSQDPFENMPLEAAGPLYAFTIQVPVIGRAPQVSTGKAGAPPNVPRHWNLTVVSNSFFEASREYSTIIDYPPYYHHIQVIVISQEAAKEGIDKFIDLFIRDPEMRRRTKLFVTPGKAKDVLNVIPNIDSYASVYLKALPQSAVKTSRMAHRTDLGRVTTQMVERSDYVLPRVIANKTEIKDAGLAVFKNNKMVGWLDEIKTNYVKWVTGYVKGGTVSINMPGSEKEVIVLEIRKFKGKQKPVVRGDSISMSLDIKVKMNISEIATSRFHSTESQEFISQTEKLAEEHIKKQMENTIDFVQKQYGADVFFFDRSMKRYEPDTWKKVKGKWDDIFKTMKVDVKVSVKIEQIGLAKY